MHIFYVFPGTSAKQNVFFEDVNALIKVCCEVISCVEEDAGSYRVRIEFIIIRDIHRECWDNYLNRKIEEKAIVI